MTNAEKIRQMTDEQLKKMICENADCSTCKFGMKCSCDLPDWLRREAEEESERPKEDQKNCCGSCLNFIRNYDVCIMSGRTVHEDYECELNMFEAERSE